MERKLCKILTVRRYCNSASFRSVFEWEDVIANKMGLQFKYDTFYKRYKICARIEKYLSTKVYHALVRKKEELCLFFVMTASIRSLCILDKNIIPVIIDFWLTTEDLPAFYKAYKECPLILITSAEVFSFLKQNNCPLPIEHWPLSLPDNVEVEYNKKIYDFCFIGRKDPFFVEMLNRYVEKYSDFEYVINNDDIENREYQTNKGIFIGKDTGRESYLDIIKKSKISVYSTPGVDKAKNVAGRFNQVTPRVLELISGGCYVLGHYPDNPDTEYYDLKSVVPQINSYSDFEFYMNLYRSKPSRDIVECRNYINKHNTSSRVVLLKNILKKHGIMLG